MPLVADTPIVTATDVEMITGEAGLSRLDEGNATIANACIQATNYLMLDLRGLKACDPAKVSNTSDLKIAAALKAAFLRLIAQPDDDNQKRAANLKARYDEAFQRYVFVSTDTGNEQTGADKGLPRSINMDAQAWFGPQDNRGFPGTVPVSGWTSK